MTLETLRDREPVRSVICYYQLLVALNVKLAIILIIIICRKLLFLVAVGKRKPNMEIAVSS